MTEKKRSLFEELQEGFVALQEAREGKQTLRSHELAMPAPASISAAEVEKYPDTVERLANI